MTTTMVERNEQAQTVLHELYDARDHLELAGAFYDALALPPTQLRRAMRSLARRAGAAEIDTRHQLTLTRLRALLQFDPEEARVLARAFDDAYLDLPPHWRESAREAELGAMINALTPREFHQLTRILPWLRDDSASSWLLDHLPDGDGGETLSEGAGTPGLALTD